MNAIKKGDKFLCTKEYVMVSGRIAYREGIKYESEYDGTLHSEVAKQHIMDYDEEFQDYFKKIS